MENPKLSSTKEVDWMLREWQKCPVELGSCIEEYTKGYFRKVSDELSEVILHNAVFSLIHYSDDEIIEEEDHEDDHEDDNHEDDTDLMINSVDGVCINMHMNLQNELRRYNLVISEYCSRYGLCWLEIRCLL